MYFCLAAAWDLQLPWPNSDVRSVYHQQHLDMASSNRNFDTPRRSRSPERSSRRDRDERDHGGARYPRRSLDRDGNRGGDRHKDHKRRSRSWSRSPRPHRSRRHRSHSRSPMRSRSRSPDSCRDKEKRKRGRSRSRSRTQSVSSEHSDSYNRRKHKHKKDRHKKRSRSRERKEGRKEKRDKKVRFSSFPRSIFTFPCRKRKMQRLAHNGENMGLSVILSASSI